MGQERARAAVERIERALARIEAAASAPAAPSADSGALREAHLALRSKVETAIGRIDRLIESGAG